MKGFTGGAIVRTLSHYRKFSSPCNRHSGYQSLRNCCQTEYRSIVKLLYEIFVESAFFSTISTGQ